MQEYSLHPQNTGLTSFGKVNHKKKKKEKKRQKKKKDKKKEGL